MKCLQQPRTKPSLFPLARHGECFLSRKINSFSRYLPLLCDLNIKPIIFSTIVQKPLPLFLPLSPSSSNLRQFGDNYSLLEEMWLAVSAASWVGKNSRKKKQLPFSLSPLGDRMQGCVCGWQWGINRIAAAAAALLLPLLLLPLVSLHAKKAGCRGRCFAAVKIRILWLPTWVPCYRASAACMHVCVGWSCYTNGSHPLMAYRVHQGWMDDTGKNENAHTCISRACAHELYEAKEHISVTVDSYIEGHLIIQITCFTHNKVWQFKICHVFLREHLVYVDSHIQK